MTPRPSLLWGISIWQLFMVSILLILPFMKQCTRQVGIHLLDLNENVQLLLLVVALVMCHCKILFQPLVEYYTLNVIVDLVCNPAHVNTSSMTAAASCDAPCNTYRWVSYSGSRQAAWRMLLMWALAPGVVC